MTRKKIVYIQHAPSLGGSVVSLKELIIDAKKNGYECAVICPNQAIADFYSVLGVKTYVAVIAPFNHNTAYFYKFTFREALRVIKLMLKTIVSFFFLFKILRKEKPHMVHLNSSTLIGYTIYCWILKIPNLLHVRETIVSGYTGFRKRIIIWMANRFANATIFISEFEYERLPTNTKNSFVIYNYVHKDEFLAVEQITPQDSNRFRLVILGGLFRLKGGNVLLKALVDLDDNVELLVLGGDDPRNHPGEIQRVDGVHYLDEVIQLLNHSAIGKKVKFIGKVPKPQQYIASADALIFWAASPHFPRPVFEAWLLKKPVLYHNPGYQNEIVDSGNVINISSSQTQELTSKIRLLKDQEYTGDLIERSFAAAINNFTEKNFDKINFLYKQCLIKY
ncbi:MAG TPA: glycosyltransferase family 4 protein [Ohtaekwangia sp.]|nr:glycosyltransferase family 4 protein [Ohtaekwangia sp.]